MLSSAVRVISWLDLSVLRALQTVLDVLLTVNASIAKMVIICLLDHAIKLVLPEQLLITLHSNVLLATVHAELVMVNQVFVQVVNQEEVTFKLHLAINNVLLNVP